MTADADPHRIECALFDLYCTLVDLQIDEETPALWAGLSAALGATGAFADPIELRRRWHAMRCRDDLGPGQRAVASKERFDQILARGRHAANGQRDGATAKRVATNLNSMLLTAVLVAVFATVTGSVLAAWLHRETGPLIDCCCRMLPCQPRASATLIGYFSSAP